MIRIIVLTLFVFCSVAALADSIYASLPNTQMLKVSPDGKKIAGVMGKTEGNLIFIYDIDTGKTGFPSVSEKGRYDTLWLDWASSDVLMMSVAFSSRKRVRGSDLKFLERRLLSFSFDTNKVSSLIPAKYQVRNNVPQFQDFLASKLPSDSDHILVSLPGKHRVDDPFKDPVYERVNNYERSVYQLNLYSKKLELIQKNIGQSRNWTVDRQGMPRITSYKSGDKWSVKHKPVGKDTSETLWSDTQYQVLGFDIDPNTLFYVDDKKLYSKSLIEEGQSELLLANPYLGDESQLVYSPETGGAIGVSLEREKGILFWGDEFDALIAGLKKAVPGAEIAILNYSKDGRQYVAKVSGVNTPDIYLYGDRDNNVLKPVGYRYPELSKMKLPLTQAVSIANDGKAFSANLTEPPEGVKPRGLMVISGVPDRNYYGSYDIWSKFFASIGFYTLNFEGLKLNFAAQQAAYKNAVDYLQNRYGKAVDKVCGLGSGYRAYSLLMLSLENPEMLDCMVLFSPFVDLAMYKNDTRHYVKESYMEKIIGDEATMEERSPVMRVNELSVPLLIVHGRMDSQVQYKQGEAFKKALKKNNKDFKFIALDDSGHYLDYYPDRVEVFEKIKEFIQ